MNLIPEVLRKQRLFFESQKTKSLAFRKTQLQALITAIENSEKKIFEALYTDLRKSQAESFIGEIALTIDEAKFAIKHLEKWAKPKRVHTPLVQAIGKSYIHSEPLGVALIIAPWNYPFQLLMAPLIGAMAAGNCAVLKPSELAPATSQCIAEIIKEHFQEDYLCTVQGGVEVSQALLRERWDHIFFTGGTEIGKIIMSEAAKHLTPVTLELGGKSPCIIDREVNIKVAAKRVAWGKFFNAGQTCVAPDYLLVPTGMKLHFIEELKAAVDSFFSAAPEKSPDYARIISDRHFQRLRGYLNNGTIAFGGKTTESERFIAPTALMNVSWDDKVMQEEIFGPVLPVMEYENLSDAIKQVNRYPKPLALYFFSSNQANHKKIIEEISFGGGCMNDTLVHLANPRLPFGGVGASGMGNYHGQFSFDTFSHKKTVFTKALFPDLALRYPPYSGKLSLLKRLLS